jgi:hypothetical protein
MNFNFNFTRIACTPQGRQRVRSRADVTWVTRKFLPSRSQLPDKLLRLFEFREEPFFGMEGRGVHATPASI